MKKVRLKFDQVIGGMPAAVYKGIHVREVEIAERSGKLNVQKVYVAEDHRGDVGFKYVSDSDLGYQHCIDAIDEYLLGEAQMEAGVTL